MGILQEIQDQIKELEDKKIPVLSIGLGPLEITMFHWAIVELDTPFESAMRIEPQWPVPIVDMYFGVPIKLVLTPGIHLEIPFASLTKIPFHEMKTEL